MARFLRQNFISDGDILTDLFQDFYFYLKGRQLQEYIVDETDEGLLDQISYKLYNSEEYWWILAKANNIVNIEDEVVRGRVLQVPSLLDINEFIALKRRQTRVNRDITI